MHDLIVQLLGYLRGIWRFRWWVLGVAWLVCAIGWFVVAQLPDRYEASARVYVDTQTLLKPLLRGLAIAGNEQRRLLLMSKTLLSRPNLEKVMRMTDLDLRAKTPEQTEEIIESLRKKIKLEATDRINLYTIRYENEDPELAKLVVKSLLTIFVEANLGDTRKEQDSARQFLEQQIADVERRLQEAEERRTRFRQANLPYLSGESGDYYSRLKQTQQQLAQAELELKIQRDRLEVLKQQIEGEVPSFGIVEDEPVTGGSSVLDGRIESLESRLDDLLLRYTDKHPDVKAVKATLAKLKRERKRELAKLAKNAPRGGGSALDSNPVYQQMRISYAEVEADVAAKEAVVEEYKKRIESLQGAVDKVLQVEKEQSQLNRDYGILKKQYLELTERLESARLSQDVDTRSNSIRFRVIDPPIVPNQPSGPPRALLSSVVLLAGLGLGILVAFLLSQIRPTFDDRRTLNEVTDLPVLGSVSMVWTQAQIRRRQRRHLGFLLGLLALVSAYAVVMASHMFELDLGRYMGEISSRIAGL
ncbi:MAG TPA: chain length-determining protein [Sedimenticola thiotaurini]|uniref:Chain length-determining protein n=1 Tax=Sedimenticola thiotaurini TaxID=1543721 RepID=A0A831WC04_9GAMM|nr:chain length-determining protein [Sedimenticola thiotaurini]